jgi:dienelactone hydrolase
MLNCPPLLLGRTLAFSKAGVQMRKVFAILVGTAMGLWHHSAFAGAQEFAKFEASQPHEARHVLLNAEINRPPGAGRFPAVVLMHGCGGWQPAVQDTLHSYARDLVNLGYVVLNVDSFGPRRYPGDEQCRSNERLQQALAYRTSDAFDAARHLRTLAFVDPRNIFLVGQSNGGSVAMKAARASTSTSDGPAFRAVVAYYPWCGVFTGNVKLASPVLVFSGGKDDWVSARECSAVQSSGANFNVIVYPQARHSFDLDIPLQTYAGFSIGRDPAAAVDSKNRMWAFFNDHLTEDLKRARGSAKLAGASRASN